jgi:hypothetical protein
MPSTKLTDLELTGTLAVTGAITATGGVTGAVTGNVTGNIVGAHRHSTQTLAASGAITITSGLVMLAHNATPVAATLAAPTAGAELYIVNTSASGTAAHTVKTATGVTLDGTNNTATLDAPGEALHLIATSSTRWFILENIGTVGLSST